MLPRKGEIMKKRVLIVGLGIGQVYKEVLSKDDSFEVITVDTDPEKNADYLCVNDVIKQEDFFDMSIICVPNYLHQSMMMLLAHKSNFILVEKPGLESAEKWKEVQDALPDNIILMTQNNLHRGKEFYEAFPKDLSEVKAIFFVWSTKNRIPFPGYWFTDKSKSFGGPSVDLLPHLLHMSYRLADPDEFEFVVSARARNIEFSEIEKTDYGVINTKNPVFDVDTSCSVYQKLHGINVYYDATWQNNRKDVQMICFRMNDGTLIEKEFGLCPNHAYGDMVRKIFEYKREDIEQHKKIDLAVLNIIDTF